MRFFRTNILFIFLYLFFYSANISAKVRHKEAIPFKMVGSSIVIEVRINNSKPLNFIFDTGVRNLIVTELWADDSISVNKSYERKLTGLGTGIDAVAYFATGNRLDIGELSIDNVNVLVLKNDVFELSRHIGTKVNGLIGYDLLKDWVVHIDYENQKLRFYDPQTFQTPQKYESLPIIIEDQKAYYTTQITTSNKETYRVKLLLDTGAELGLWLTNYNHQKIPLPDKKIRAFIGVGLSGPIYGYLGQIEMLTIGKNSIRKPYTAFPDSIAIHAVSNTYKRSGSIGSEILQKFNIIFNLHDTTVYIKRNKNFSKPLNINRTGIEIIKESAGSLMLEVSYIWPNSPAEKAGVLPGDKLLYIDNVNCLKASLSEVKSYFYSQLHGKMHVTLFRNGEIIKLKINVNKIE